MAKKNEKEEAQVVKKKPRGGNSPVIGDNGLETLPGDNAKFLGVQMALLNMPDIDMDNVKAVQDRLNEYLMLYAQNDMKPTVAGMAISLNGMNRRTLWAIVNDLPTGGAGYKTALRPEVAYVIKKTYLLMENLWESYMNSGKINPMAGVFLGVNNYGYQDVKKVDLAPVLPDNKENDYDPDSIRKRYLIDSGSDSPSDSDSD